MPLMHDTLRVGMTRVQMHLSVPGHVVRSGEPRLTGSTGYMWTFTYHILTKATWSGALNDMAPRQDVAYLHSVALALINQIRLFRTRRRQFSRAGSPPPASARLTSSGLFDCFGVIDE